MYHWVRDCTNSYMNLIKKKDSVDEDINISLHSETMSYFVEETFSAIVLDSGCTGNVCGKMWLKCKYLYLLMPSGNKKVTHT